MDTSPNASLNQIQWDFCGYILSIPKGRYLHQSEWLLSASKELTVHVMGPVETLSINAIDVPHAPGQVGIRGLG